MSTLIQIRQDLAINFFNANTLLAQGEMALEIDTRLLKIGDGITYWNLLPYYSSSYGVNASNIGNDSSIPGTTVKDALNNLTSIQFSCGKNNKTTNTYLRTDDGIPSNISPFIAPYNLTLTGISVSTNSAMTWDAEIHVNGTSVATLSIPGVDKMYNTSYNVNINVDDKISLYCNGTNIEQPRILAIFKRR